jgi:hypothetical protein
MGRRSLTAVLAALLLGGVCGCVRITKKGDLIYKGTVTSIDIAETGDPNRNFVVTTKVDRVVCGSFSGKRFQFAIHSPARSNIEVGKQYRIVATRLPEGYEVDPDQWQSPWSFWVCG